MPSLVVAAEAYRARQTATTDAVLRVVAGIWDGMDSWSDAAADDMIRQVVPVVTAGQRASAASTAAYIGQVTGTPGLRIDLDRMTTTVLRGVDIAAVYRRPVITARATYADTGDVTAALNTGLRQITGTASTDLQLAATHTARNTMTAAGVTTYRRVTKPGACPLCIAASDRVYDTADLLPIHTRCHCIVLPASRIPTRLQTTGEPMPDGKGLRIDHNDEIGPVVDYDEQVAAIQTPTAPAHTPTADEIVAAGLARRGWN